MDNSTDSLITARLLATARYTVVFNALLFVLSAQRGGAWSAVQLVLPGYCCTTTSASNSTAACSKILPTAAIRPKPSTKPCGKPACAVFQTPPPCRSVWRVRLHCGVKTFT